MKILFITSIIPYPPIRGDKLRIYNIIRNLKSSNEVKVISIVKNNDEEKYAIDLRNSGYNLSTVSISRKRGIFNLLRSLWTFEPFQVSFHYSKKMHRLINNETKSNNYDLVYFHLFTTAQYVKSIDSPNSIKVLDITDATALYLTRFIEFIKNPLRKLFFLLELNLIKKYEQISSSFDVNYVCSNVDLRYYHSKNINGNFRLFTNGIDQNTFKKEPISIIRYRIIFVGNLPYFPNRDAVLYFAKEVFPKVLKIYPSATFYIVGSNPPEDIKKLESPNIFITGYVEDIKHEYLISEVNVAPIRFGAGIQNKIIEALALGVPTVSSKMSVESFDDEIKKYIFTAETPDEFVKQISNVFSDSFIRNKTMRECSEIIKSKLTWEKVVGDEEVYLKNLFINKTK